MTDSKKKKKALRWELIIGGGLGVIFLPVVLLALVWALIAVGLGALLTFVSRTDASVFTIMLAVYGTLFLLLLFFGYKFSARLIVVIRRMLNIRREQQRVQAEFAHLEDHEADPDGDLDVDDFQQDTQHADVV